MKKRGRGRPKKVGQLVHLRLAPETYRALKARADADGRSLTATVDRLLQSALTQTEKEAIP